jgi:hypothetical protein
MNCVAVRLLSDDEIEVVAPHGLWDLFGMVVRRNPVADVASFRRRLDEKRYVDRWALVEVVE